MPSDSEIFPNNRFHLPADDAPLWRYMTVTQLISVLAGRLYFPSIDELARLHPFREGDPLEGGLTATEVSAVEQYRDRPDALAEAPSAPVHLQLVRRRFAASCWHCSGHESRAMWDLYATRGVAIKSTLRRLAAAVDESGLNVGEEVEVSAGLVEYVDYRATFAPSLPADHLLPRAVLDDEMRMLRKDLSFRHEEEFRLLLERPSGGSGWGRGVDVPCDPDKLIDSIVMHPSTGDWELRSVAALTDRFGLAGRVIQSGLKEVPEWSLTMRNELQI